MKIKMLTSRFGSDVENNWKEGQIFDVSCEVARSKVDAQLAINLEPFEVAIVKAPEKALGASGEKTLAPGYETASKVPVAAPVSPDAVILAQIAAATHTEQLLAFRVEGRSQEVEEALNAKGAELFEAEKKVSEPEKKVWK